MSKNLKKILYLLPLEMKFLPIPSIKLVVRNKKEKMIAYCKLSEDSALSDTAITI